MSALEDAAAAHKRVLAAQQEMREAAAVRDAAVRSARAQGVGVEEIRVALGVNRARVYQILGKS